MSAPRWIEPDWPAPGRVRALSTTRAGGVSAGPFGALNLAAHVGDDPAAVAANRARLRAAAGLPAEPAWLRQVHGARVVRLPAGEGEAPEADGAWTDRPGVVCAVLTADCLPVLLCDRAGTRVAALHAGWRGLAAGVLEAGVAALGAEPGTLLAWLGPAIGPAGFVVGREVVAALGGEPGAAPWAVAAGGGRWRVDLWAVARERLARAGVAEIHGGGLCTWSDAERFYSYRREGRTGRMATLVWLDPAA